MKYRDMNDNELLYYVSEGIEEAYDVLFKKYDSLINNAAAKMLKHCKGTGIEFSDLIQEGMVGLSNAVNNFDENKEASFYTYAKMCIERNIISYVICQRRSKHRFLNESVSYENNDENYKYEAVMTDNTFNPEEQVILKEQTKLLYDKVSKRLTETEIEVFELKQSGFNYKEIARILNKSDKSVDNTLTRIKAKLKEELAKLNR